MTGRPSRSSRPRSICAFDGRLRDDLALRVLAEQPGEPGIVERPLLLNIA